jgi:AcrR family transcriptional regulator
MPARKKAATVAAGDRDGEGNGDIRDVGRAGTPAKGRELRARGQRTMRRLLDAGITVFATRGYHSARVDDIVKAAKTSHGTFYLYFANKEDLFQALVADVADELEALTASLGDIGPGDAGRDQLRSWLVRFATMYEHYGPIIRTWTEAELDSSEVGRLGTDVLAGLTAALAERVAAAQTDLDPQLAALAAVAMIERFNYFVLSRQVAANPEEMVDTLAGVIHRALFG